MNLEGGGAHAETIVAVSPAMQRLLHLAERIAPTESNILLTGESGTGKEKVARQIHYQSTRSRGPFVAVNMAAIPETLIESELFGHARGAFTDAKRAKRGFFEMADGGTIFLDEIGDMSPTMQTRLLRVLQDHIVQPVGAERPIKVDARVIAATNRDLRQEIAERRFREDLFFRLNVFHLHVPPLRERKEDIRHLVAFFIERLSQRMGKKIRAVSDQAWGFLMNYDYPGNVRELENAIERAFVLAEDGDEIKVWDLPPEITEPGIRQLPKGDTRLDSGGGPPPSTDLTYPLELQLDEVEERHIRGVVERSGGNLSRAADSLGISRTTLWRKLKKYRANDVSRKDG